VITRRALPLAIGLSWHAFARAAPGVPSRSLSSLDPTDIVSILAQDQVLSPHRTVRRAAHIGDLLIDGRKYPAINLIEEHATAYSKRSFRRVVLLKPDLRKAYVLPYIYYPSARPVSCHENVLVFSDAIEINNTLPSGRQVEFTNRGADAEVLEDR
jgi:hypothetical protein